jgi:septal ring factor EnvC (AmiA/AmiB activator)
VGFPIALVAVLGWFIYKIYTDTTAANKAAQERMQEQSKEREEKLYEEIKANREVNAQAIATIGLYADSLNTIQRDISDIKTDITIITERIN